MHKDASHKQYRLTWLLSAFHKWISYCGRWTTTDGTVVNNLTTRSIATHSWTWVSALCVHARLVSGAVWANDTLWATATAARTAMKPGQAFTECISTWSLTTCVGSTRWRVTWVYFRLLCNYKNIFGNNYTEFNTKILSSIAEAIVLKEDKKLENMWILMNT